MDRRDVLKRVAVAGGASLAGLGVYTHFNNPPPEEPDLAESMPTDDPTESPTQSKEPTPSPTEPVPHGDEFDTVVDVVAAGADPDGNEPIGEFLETYADDNTLLSFPAGTYVLPQLELGEYDHLGLAAAGEDRPTFVAPADSCHNDDPHVQFERVTNFLLEGIDFDFENEGAGGAINVIASGDATVRDVTTRGTCGSQITMFRIDIRDEGGVGIVENLRAENSGTDGWMTGAYVGKRHSGEVTFRNCELSEFSDNGLYGSAPGTDGGGGGTVHTEDGDFRNNNVSNIRLGTAGSTARGDSILVESPPEAESINLRGIRFRRGAEQVVEDCDIEFGSDVTESFGAIVYHRENGGARVANSTVTMHSDHLPALRAFYHSDDTDTAPTFENLTIDGDADRGFAALINGRDGTRFENCSIEQTGDHRDGIRIAYSQDCELVDCRIDVTGYPLILRDSTLTVRDTTFVTPDGERHVDEMEAEPGDFRPEAWT